MSKIHSIFFIGIGGVSMSALAKLMNAKGLAVSGSDLKHSFITSNLEKHGIKIYHDGDTNNLPSCDLVCFSGAIKEDDIYLQYYKSRSTYCIERSTLLGMISREYKNVIAIAGTHGKTTTTAMIAYTFLLSGKNPTVHVGGFFKGIGGNLRIGERNYFITEACEYRDSFLSLSPTVSVITNIEPEHLDYFKNFEKEKKSFSSFLECTKEKCFVNYEYKNLLTEKKSVVNYFGRSGLTAENIKLEKDGKYSFLAKQDGDVIGKVKLNVYGKHNILNSLACICVCRYFGIENEIILTSLNKFENVDRRMELLGKNGEAFIFSDYAHHPTEIKSSISICKESFKNKKIVCIFEPHTYSRTKLLLKEFISCFDGVNVLYLLDNYSAREEYDFFGSSEFLIKNLNAEKINAKYLGDKKMLLKELRKYNSQDYLIIFLGAGDIDNLARNFAKVDKPKIDK